jgi:hypothetical protein
VCGAVRNQRAQDRAVAQRRVATLRRLGAQVRASHEEMLADITARIEARLLPVDPLRQTWNAFRMFDLEYEEIRWTQWFAGLLRPANGERCARVAWRAFCEAVAERAELAPPAGDSNPADHHCWHKAAEETPLVHDEVWDSQLGILDLLFMTPSLTAAVENKLWSGWHDGSKAPQADRYRELANKRRIGDARLGLVLLSERKGMKLGDYPPDYVHVSWRDVGRALRRALRHEWTDDQQCAIELWPIILTLVSIEQDLLKLSLTPRAFANRAAVLKLHSDLATYLEGR